MLLWSPGEGELSFHFLCSVPRERGVFMLKGEEVRGTRHTFPSRNESPVLLSASSCRHLQAENEMVSRGSRLFLRSPEMLMLQ